MTDFYLKYQTFTVEINFTVIYDKCRFNILPLASKIGLHSMGLSLSGPGGYSL